MVTNTAIYRYEHYHAASDTVDQIDFERLSRVSEGVNATVRRLAARGR